MEEILREIFQDTDVEEAAADVEHRFIVTLLVATGIACAVFSSRIDYCNAVIYGVTTANL